MSSILYLKYDGVLMCSQDKDDPGSFKPIGEGTFTAIDVGSTIYWKISSEPGTLEDIKIKKANKKEEFYFHSFQ